MLATASVASSHATTFAAERQDELPASHMQLLQLLGCSSKGVLWAAGVLAAESQGLSYEVLRSLAAVRTITPQWARACILQQGQDSGAGAAPCVVDTAPDVLTATVMLHCAAHLVPEGSLNHPWTEPYVELCKHAAVLA
jgi:hypothetical protein